MKGLFSYDSPVMGALTSIGDCICLSAMWLVFSLPIFTIGASTTALYAAAYHVVRKKEGGLWRCFWGAFRENFKRSTLIWLVVLVVMALLTVDVFVLRVIRLSGGAMFALCSFTTEGVFRLHMRPEDLLREADDRETDESNEEDYDAQRTAEKGQVLRVPLCSVYSG